MVCPHLFCIQAPWEPHLGCFADPHVPLPTPLPQTSHSSHSRWGSRPFVPHSSHTTGFGEFQFPLHDLSALYSHRTSRNQKTGLSGQAIQRCGDGAATPERKLAPFPSERLLGMPYGYASPHCCDTSSQIRGLINNTDACRTALGVRGLAWV